jgi:hypothetical protein
MGTLGNKWGRKLYGQQGEKLLLKSVAKFVALQNLWAIVMPNTPKSKLGAAFHGIFILNCKLLRFYLQKNTKRVWCSRRASNERALG